MASKFTTSVNIIRDSEKELNYIPTPNAVRVVNQLANDYKLGVRSFNIIGSYGTGKSAFLWAFQQSITGRKKHFGINILQNPSIGFINMIGEYKSIKETFADYFEVKNNRNLSENIFSEIYNRYHDLGKKNPLLFIVIDEFGKFLEFAAQNEPEKELYFIQQLSEFVNNPDSNIILLTAVHQNFDAYAISLNNSQKQEWTKVKGRFREITFNEPVEQLLFLASEHLNKRSPAVENEKSITKANNLFIKSKAFSINADYLGEISSKLYPLDLFSASILTSSLQKYGQNERSLFSFLESTDHTGIVQHQFHNSGFYSIAEVYDYLIFNFYSYINSRYNPDFSAWKSIKSTLERVDNIFEKDINLLAKIIKTIGLLNIFTAAGSSLDKAFIVGYSEQCLGIKNAAYLIEELEVKKLILFRNYSNRYVLFEGTDLDFQTALLAAGNKINEITDITTLLKKHYQLPPIIAKEISYTTGTPRLFEYVISAHPIDQIPQGEIDGYINLIFNDKLKQSEIIEYSSKQKEAILYCYYKKSGSIKDLLLEIEKTKKVIEENIDDRVAVRELNNSILHQQNFLTHKILNNFYSVKPEVVWIFKGKEIDIPNRKVFNKQLSEICRTIYSKSPIFNNELVNKHKISSSIHTAKRNYYKALTANWDKPHLGFPENKFPPEKTIYLSLLESNNINLISDELDGPILPNNKNKFQYLWKVSNDFLDSAKISRRKVSEFVELLGKRPYKLKQGLIDFWIPTFLFIKRDDFALFGENGYIPFLNDEVLELMVKDPDEYEIKTFDIDGVKLDIFNSYRKFLNQQQELKLTGSTFIETIKPFLTFYRDLPDYAKNTNRLSSEARSIRTAIANSKDPEKTFFEDFPAALGFKIENLQSSKNDLQRYITKLQISIRELRTCYDELVNRIELFVQTEIIFEDVPFEGYKENLQNRYKKLRRHLLLSNQKIFVQRLDSLLDDKKAWLNSIVQALIGKSLEKIQDEDEVMIYDKFHEMILSLDSLTKISKSDYKEDKEDIFDLQINSFVDGISNKLVRLPKSKQKEISEIGEVLKKGLSKDRLLNIAALTNLLKDLIK
ncbi:hypothetical protein [Mucilaginibacter ginsenosidivorans]|uniref:ATP-binding protein n=1 Tax=Mucilaginibacter ginsenosidivorans TaxID=398053 RepID=A0A5B8UTD0_9SPHI|nr:hypothetical protein [Mucilaginibacter ginsenosidivorans]QEC61975.1 hypothetical protein FRZ54_05025 [Mucilaginibacter ginsenosidivorans]